MVAGYFIYYTRTLPCNYVNVTEAGIVYQFVASLMETKSKSRVHTAASQEKKEKKKKLRDYITRRVTVSDSGLHSHNTDACMKRIASRSHGRISYSAKP